MNLYQIDDMEWWIGPDAASVIAAVKDEYGYDDALLEDFQELDGEALDTLIYQDSDEDNRAIGEARTFRAQLAIEVAAGGRFPRMFAAQDF